MPYNLSFPFETQLDWFSPNTESLCETNGSSNSPLMKLECFYNVRKEREKGDGNSIVERSNHIIPILLSNTKPNIVMLET